MLRLDRGVHAPKDWIPRSSRGMTDYKSMAMLGVGNTIKLAPFRIVPLNVIEKWQVERPAIFSSALLFAIMSV